MLAYSIFSLFLSPVCPPDLSRGTKFKALKQKYLAKKWKKPVLFLIVVLNTSELSRIIVVTLVRGKLDDRVRQHVFGHPSLPFGHLVLEVILGSYNEVGTGTMEAVELRKEVVRTVKDVVRSGLNRYLLRSCGICRRYYEIGRASCRERV